MEATELSWRILALKHAYIERFDSHPTAIVIPELEFRACRWRPAEAFGMRVLTEHPLARAGVLCIIGWSGSCWYFMEEPDTTTRAPATTRSGDEPIRGIRF